MSELEEKKEKLYKARMDLESLRRRENPELLEEQIAEAIKRIGELRRELARCKYQLVEEKKEGRGL